MVSRLAARLATGPLGFLVAGVIDVGVLLLMWGAHSLVVRVRRLAR